MTRKMKEEYFGVYSKSSNNIEIESKKECRMIWFPSNSTLNEITKTISSLKRNIFQNLFVISFDIDNVLESMSNEIEENEVICAVEEAFQPFGNERPKMLVLRKEIGSKFFLGHEKLTESNDISSVLLKFEANDPQNFDDITMQEIFNFHNSYSSTILRYIKSFKIADEFHEALIKHCVIKGTVDNLLAILGSPLESEERVISESTEKILSNTNDLGNSSVLQEAIKYKNEEIINYLISNCTHLIQELPLKHRIEISTLAFVAEQYKILCDLLEYSDFPFPKNLKDSPLTDKKLREIVNERLEFHLAIIDANFEKISNFITTRFTNLKLVFNSNNETALSSAISSKQFKVYGHLKSLGFEAEEFHTNDEINELLTAKDLKDFKQVTRDQSEENVKNARWNKESHLHLLITRSLIHNRMIVRQDEESYRLKIKKWFESINRNEICSKFLNLASQCINLRLIFDFKSKSVS